MHRNANVYLSLPSLKPNHLIKAKIQDYAYVLDAQVKHHVRFVCVPSGAFTEDGLRRQQAFVLLFAVFDETKSWYGEVGERMIRDKFKRGKGRKEYHTINGYVNSTLPGKEGVCLREVVP